jgi:hypothetical protein
MKRMSVLLGLCLLSSLSFAQLSTIQITSGNNKPVSIAVVPLSWGGAQLK